MGEPLYGTQKNKRTGAVRDVVSNDGGKTWQPTEAQVIDDADNESIAARGGIDLALGPGKPAIPATDQATAAPPVAQPKPAAPPRKLSPVEEDRELMRALAEQDERDRKNRPPPRDPYTPMESFGFGGLEGMSLGMAGGAYGLGASLAGDDVPRDPRTPEPSAAELGDTYREQRDLAYTDNPVPAMAGDILGGAVATAPLGALKPVQAAASVAPVATGAGLGGLVGAFEGATRAHSGQALEGAKEGAASGALAGGALPMLGRSLGGLIGAAEGALGSPAGMRTEGAARGFEKGVDLSSALGRAADTKRAQSSNLGADDATRMVNEGSQVLERPTESPSGQTVFPEGTRVPKNPNAVSELGARMEKHGLTGSQKDLVTKSELAKMEAVQEMDTATHHLASMGGDVRPDAHGTAPLQVDLSGLAQHLGQTEQKLRRLGLPEFTREAEGVLEDYTAITSDPMRNFQTALELRRALDKKAYDAAGQKAGALAEGYRAMATEVRRAIDKTLERAPPETAAQLRNAFEKYETAADVSEYAAGGIGSLETSRLGVQDMNIMRRVPVVGAAVKASERYGARAASNAYRAGQELLLGSPGMLGGTMTAAPTPDEIEEIRRAQLGLSP